MKMERRLTVTDSDSEQTASTNDISHLNDINTYYLENSEFWRELQRNNCLWLPVTLPANVCKENKERRSDDFVTLPSDIAFWLYELRHSTECSFLDRARTKYEFRVKSDESGDSPSDKTREDIACSENFEEHWDSKSTNTSGFEDGQEELLDDSENDLNNEEISRPETNESKLARPPSIEWRENPTYNNVFNNCDVREGRGLNSGEIEVRMFNQEPLTKLHNLHSTYKTGRGIDETLYSSKILENCETEEVHGKTILKDDTGLVPLNRCIYSIQEESGEFCESVESDNIITDDTSQTSCCFSYSDADDNVIASDTALNAQLIVRSDFEENVKLTPVHVPEFEVNNPNFYSYLFSSIDESSDGSVSSESCPQLLPLDPNDPYDVILDGVESNLKTLMHTAQTEEVFSEVNESVIHHDDDFLHLCDEITILANEEIEQCSKADKTPIKLNLEILNKEFHNSESSEISDSVFLSSPGSENTMSFRHNEGSGRRHSFNINSIFDDGMTKPVRPERRKKRRKTVPNIEESHDDTSKSSCKYYNFSARDNPFSHDNALMITEKCSSKSNTCNFIMNNFSVSPEMEQEILLMEKASKCSKEKRNLHSISVYEDADSCCNVNMNCVCADHEEDVTISKPVEHDCNESVNIIQSSFDQISYLCSTGTDSQVADISSSITACSEESSSYNSCNSAGNMLSINLTHTRPISSSFFPPENYCNLLETLRDGNLQSEDSMYSAENLGSSSEEIYYSVESFRSRKGSDSSDIVAWKDELQRSLLFSFDEELDVEYMQSEQWFSSLDSEGKVCNSEENSNDSTWGSLSQAKETSNDSDGKSNLPGSSADDISSTTLDKEAKADVSSKIENLLLRHREGTGSSHNRGHIRVTKSSSMVLVDSKHRESALSKSSSIPRNWPQLWNGGMKVLREGTLYRTKLTENGKRVRKNWASSHVVLTELFLLFFKDAKTFSAMKASGSTLQMLPEICVDLNGAMLDTGEKVSSRKNVFVIRTVLDLQVLIQCENTETAEDWYHSINEAISNLPSGYNTSTPSKPIKNSREDLLQRGVLEEVKKSFHQKESSPVRRSKSVKVVKNNKASIEDLSATSDEQQKNIRKRLRNFFHRRPTREYLVKKGIYKDEPVFGRNLADVCKAEYPKVPHFVSFCIDVIESKEENMKTDGLYRASGNLSQVQKIRLQVDQNNFSALEQEEDVHVLTGALKLFFRELKKPLIPFEVFNKALDASKKKNTLDKVKDFREIVRALPRANRDTLEFLLRHLLNVTKYEKYNLMHISNLAIVFGPTLMWPEEESSNLAVDLMQQNLVIECLLKKFNEIFR